MVLRIAFALLCLTLISGCADSAGNHAVLSTNKLSFYVLLDNTQVVQGGATTGNATVDLTIDLDDNSVSANMSLNGVDATSVALMKGYAGQTGTVLISLTKNSSSNWSIPAGTLLSNIDLTALNGAGLYFEVNSTSNPEGALRGQIIPDGYEIVFTDLTGTEVAVPSGGVSTSATARAGTTLDTATETITIHIFSQGLLDASSASINQADPGLNGPLIIDFTQDADDLSHWFIDNASLTQTQYTALRNGELYFTLATPAWPDGEVRGQFLLSGSVVIKTEATLSSIQDTILTPTCATSGCHKGKVPSAGLDLSIGQSYVNMVNVKSTQVPELMLVLPGDASNSYLSHKLDGTATSGGLMPTRGSLTSDEIQVVNDWINAGALDN